MIYGNTDPTNSAPPPFKYSLSCVGQATVGLDLDLWLALFLPTHPHTLSQSLSVSLP